MTSAPTPVAEGDLEKTPFAHVLLSIANRAMSGTLALWPESAEKRGQDRVLFRDGRIVAARLLDPASALDRALLAFFPRKSGPYAFYEQDLVGEADGVLRGDVDPLWLLAASLRGATRDDAVESVLRATAGKVLRLRADAAVARFGSTPKESAIFERMRAEPCSLPTLASRAGDEKTAKRMVYLLTVTKMIDLVDPTGDVAGRVSLPNVTAAIPRPAAPNAAAAVPDAAAASTGRATGLPRPPRTSAGIARPRKPQGGETVPDPPSDLPDAAREKWLDVQRFAAGFESMNFFDMLGVGEAASPDEVQEAYFTQIKQLHPDRLPPELAPIKPFADRIFHYLTEARDLLADPEKRIAYVKTVRGGGGTPEADRKMQAILTAAMEFQKVEVLARRREWGPAQERLDVAIELNPDEADFYAFKAWMLFEQHGVAGNAPTGLMLELIERALKLREAHERAHFTKALILDRQGRAAEALTHFQRAAQINPKNLDAARRVRLAEMRARPQAATPPESTSTSSGGLLSKLFTKKKE